MAENFDLSTVFKTVTEALKENQTALDAADKHNGDHGTHMVETFKIIQKAVASKSAAPASDQLAYASELLRTHTSSGSAKLYAEGLQEAAEQFTGKEFNQKSAGLLINALMGSKPSAQNSSDDFLSTLLGGLTGGSQSTPQAPVGGDLLSTLLGGLSGSQSQQQPQPSQSGGSDLLSTLLGGLGGGTSSSQSSGGGMGDLLSSLLGGQSSSQSGSSGLDSKDLLSAALAYFSAKQSGQSNMQSIMQAISAASRFSGSKDRAQSGAVVVNTILNMIGSN